MHSRPALGARRRQTAEACTHRSGRRHPFVTGRRAFPHSHCPLMDAAATAARPLRATAVHSAPRPPHTRVPFVISSRRAADRVSLNDRPSHRRLPATRRARSQLEPERPQFRDGYRPGRCQPGHTAVTWHRCRSGQTSRTSVSSYPHADVGGQLGARQFLHLRKVGNTRTRSQCAMDYFRIAAGTAVVRRERVAAVVIEERH